MGINFTDMMNGMTSRKKIVLVIGGILAALVVMKKFRM